MLVSTTFFAKSTRFIALINMDIIKDSFYSLIGPVSSLKLEYDEQLGSVYIPTNFIVRPKNSDEPI